MFSMFQSTRPCGARPAFTSSRSRSTGFNPRARVGRDDGVTPTPGALVSFQSTRPCGARRGVRVTAGHIVCFNPRARVGRDFASCWSV